jgi:hypothetical protein
VCKCPTSIAELNTVTAPAATCRKWSEYRFFATCSSFPAKCVLLLSHFGVHRSPAPDRSSTSVALARKNLVVGLDESGGFSPFRERLQDSRMNRHGFCDDSVLQGLTTPYTMERVTYMFLCAKSMSLHFKPNISLCRKPVEAASRTNVRSRMSKWSTNALISLGTRTVGGLRRFAL